MRVLIAHGRYRVSGGEDSYVRQQVALLEPDHTVRLEARDNAELEGGLRTVGRMVGLSDEYRQLRKAILAFGPDVVHLHNPYPSFGPAVHRAAGRSGVPLVQTMHNLRLRCPNGLQFTEGAPCRRCEGGAYHNAVVHDCFPARTQAAGYAAALWINRFPGRLDGRVDTYIAPSRFFLGRLIDWGFPAERIALVRNFTIPPGTPPPLGDRGLYLGRLSPEKGIDVLLRALAAAGDPPFDIAGTGPSADGLVQLAGTLGLRRTRFLGLVAADEVPSVIGAARYLVFPSRWDENAPLAALEGMAHGRPIVASATGGLPELAAGDRGRCVAPDDPAALAAAMAAYEDQAAAEADGARARAFVQEECTPDRHLEGLLGAYAQAIAVHETREPGREGIGGMA